MEKKLNKNQIEKITSSCNSAWEKCLIKQIQIVRSLMAHGVIKPDEDWLSDEIGEEVRIKIWISPNGKKYWREYTYEPDKDWLFFKQTGWLDKLYDFETRQPVGIYNSDTKQIKYGNFNIKKTITRGDGSLIGELVDAEKLRRAKLINYGTFTKSRGVNLGKDNTSISTSDEDAIVVERWTSPKGKKYLRDFKTNMLFDPKDVKPVGLWNEEEEDFSDTSSESSIDGGNKKKKKRRKNLIKKKTKKKKKIKKKTKKKKKNKKKNTRYH